MKQRHIVVMLVVVGLALLQAVVAIFILPERVKVFGYQTISDMKADGAYSAADGVALTRHIGDFRSVWVYDLFFTGAFLTVVLVWFVLEVREDRRTRRREKPTDFGRN